MDIQSGTTLSWDRTETCTKLETTASWDPIKEVDIYSETTLVSKQEEDAEIQPRTTLVCKETEEASIQPETTPESQSEETIGQADATRGWNRKEEVGTGRGDFDIRVDKRGGHTIRDYSDL